MSEFNNVLYKLLGTRIKDLRKERRMTQGQLAENINGISRTSISNIENGNQQLPIHILYQICNNLDIDVHLILPSYNEIEEKVKLSDFNIEEQLREYGLNSETNEKIISLIEKRNK